MINAENKKNYNNDNDVYEYKDYVNFDPTLNEINATSNKNFIEDVDNMNKKGRLTMFRQHSTIIYSNKKCYSNYINDNDIEYFIANNGIKLMEECIDDHIFKHVFRRLQKNEKIYTPNICKKLYDIYCKYIINNSDITDYYCHYNIDNLFNLVINNNYKYELHEKVLKQIYDIIIKDLFCLKNCAYGYSSIEKLGMLHYMTYKKHTNKNYIYYLMNNDNIIEKIINFGYKLLHRDSNNKYKNDSYRFWKYFEGLYYFIKNKELAEEFNEKGLIKLIHDAYDKCNFIQNKDIQTLFHIIKLCHLYKKHDIYYMKLKIICNYTLDNEENNVLHDCDDVRNFECIIETIKENKLNRMDYEKDIQ